MGIEPLATTMTRGARLGEAVGPASVDGFEDLTFLFTSSQLQFGIALLGLDEAAYLWRVASSLRPDATVVEIGRFKGGSTLLLAAALRGEGEVWSYDLHVKLPEEVRGTDLDDELSAALARYGLEARVRLIVGPSQTAPGPRAPVDFIFVDGDHAYDAVRADYERWRTYMCPGSHIVFHDGPARRAFGTPHEGVVRLVEELRRDDGAYFREQLAPGTLVHLIRTHTAAPWSEGMRPTGASAAAAPSG